MPHFRQRPVVIDARPFVSGSRRRVLRGLNPHLREAAAVQGASPRRVWREVDLPMLAPALIVSPFAGLLADPHRPRTGFPAPVRIELEALQAACRTTGR